MSRLSDHVETNRTPAGTRVTMHFDSAVTGDLAGRGDPGPRPSRHPGAGIHPDRGRRGS
ncbi:hypothetical protein PJN45_29190, partial [Mycobacterium kansasii]